VPLGKRQQLVIRFYKLPFLLPNVIKNRLHEHDCFLEDLFDISFVLLQSTFETTSPFTNVSCQRDFLLYTSLQIKSSTSIVCFAEVQCSYRLKIGSVNPEIIGHIEIIKNIRKI